MFANRQIFLNIVKGTRPAAESRRNGKALKIARDDVAGCMRADIQGAGVYFLFCGNGEDGDEGRRARARFPAGSSPALATCANRTTECITSDNKKMVIIETATNGVDSLGGPRSVAATYDGRDRARPSLMQIKPFNCRSNKRLNAGISSTTERVGEMIGC